MTNRERIINLPTEEFYKQAALLAYSCNMCAYWHDGKCCAGGGDTCTKGHVLWLDAECEGK